MRPLTRRLATVLLSAAAFGTVAGPPSRVAAFKSSGCALLLTALDAAGNPLATAMGGADDATQERPLVVPWDGSLRWETAQARVDPAGAAAAAPASWHVEAFGLPTPVRGADPQPASSGSISIADLLPFRLSGLFSISGEWTVPGSTCRASGWLRIGGDPFSTLPFSVALAFLLLGAVLLAVGGRGSWAASIGGGVLIGCGSLVLLVIYALLPFGARTPPAMLLMGLLLGLLVGLAASRPRRRKASSQGP